MKDELADVLDDIDQSMSELYVAEENTNVTTTTESSYPGSPGKQSGTNSSQNYSDQFQNGQTNGMMYGYSTQSMGNQQQNQPPQPQFLQQQQSEVQGQPFMNYNPDGSFHQQNAPFPQGHQFPQQQGQMQQQIMQQQQMQQQGGMTGVGMGGYNMPGRGQMTGSQPVPLQQGMGMFDMGNGQTAIVNPNMMGMDPQNAGYYMSVLQNGQQAMYMDPYYQSRMNMPNPGPYPQMQPEVAYTTPNVGGDGMGFMQYGQPPNAMGPYWTPQGAVNMTPEAAAQMQNAMMMQQRGQGRGMFMPQDHQQFNNGMPHVNQQQLNMLGRGMMPNMAGGNYPMQQNVQNGFGNGPTSPNRIAGNVQTPHSPTKGSQQDGFPRQDGQSGDSYDDNSGHGSNRRGFNGGRSNSNGERSSPSMLGNSSGSSVASRDPIVEDFRNTYGKGKQWEIRDLVGHVVAFCQDQHGSRFIQQRLEVATDPDKQIVFDEVLPAAHSLMTDVFGNYVIQKLFEFGTPDQCETLAVLLMGQAVPLALQMYGCRVIQKALEYVATDRLVALVGEFEGQQVLKCVHDQNGNHVIQKCIEVVSRVAKESQPEHQDFLSSRIQFIIQAFSGRVRELSMHPYGCRVVQRILEHCTNTQKAPVLDELRKCCRELIQDQYGNYVIQHVMQHGWETDKAILIEEVQSRLLEYSQHKFASNVVEKCIQYADKKDRDKMIWTIINVTFDLNNPVDAKTGQCVLENMVRDPYANYVVQKVIDVSDASQRGAIIRYMRENIVQLRRYTYGKHIIIRLEKVSGEKF